jgi:hypothetical protein
LPFRREHRPGIDAACSCPEQETPAPEDRSERAFGNSRDLADEIELVILQPDSHTGIQLGQYIEWVRGKKFPLFTGGHMQQRIAAPLPRCPSARPGCGLTHQLVGSNSN